MLVFVLGCDDRLSKELVHLEYACMNINEVVGSCSECANNS